MAPNPLQRKWNRSIAWLYECHASGPTERVSGDLGSPAPTAPRATLGAGVGTVAGRFSPGSRLLEKPTCQGRQTHRGVEGGTRPISWPVHALQDKLFGRKSEKSTGGDRSNDLFDPEGVTATVKKRGAQPGHAGHGRRDHSHLPVEEEFVALPEESLICPIEPMLQPIYEALCERNRQGNFHQADETRWLVFAVLDGKKGYGWWLWVILGPDTAVYLLAPSRGHEVPQSHFGSRLPGRWRWIGTRATRPWRR